MKPSLKRSMLKAFSRQQGLCFWCGKPMELPRAENHNRPKRVSAEHVVPRSKGGTNQRGNIAAAHTRCNNLRRSNDQSPKVWDKIAGRRALARATGETR